MQWLFRAARQKIVMNSEVISEYGPAARNLIKQDIMG